MTSFPTTLARYLFGQFLLHFIGLLAGLLLIVYIFDTVELLRRAASVPDLPLTIVLQMGLFKLPEVGQMVIPFAVLFSALFTFWQLTRRSELVVVRAAGLSVWQFMLPMAAAALLIGIVQMTVINPMGALLIGRYERLQTQIFDKDDASVSLSAQGLWLRQKTAQGTALIHAASVRQPQWVLEKVMVLYLDKQAGFVERVDSRMARLSGAAWQFEDVVRNRPGSAPVRQPTASLPTSFSVAEIENSFASPKMVPFWSLPAYIDTMVRAGFNALPLKIEYQALIAQPLFLLGMVLLAACVALRPQRQGGTAFLIMTGVVLGFLIFFLNNFLQALGASGQIPVFMAAWFPPVIYCLAGIAGLMVLEDG